MTCSYPSIPSVADSVANEGLVAATTTYNYPTTASNLNDVPQFTQRTDNWAGNTNGVAITTFSSNPTAGTTSVTDPYGVITETQKSTGGPFAGLVYSTTVKAANGTVAARADFVYGKRTQAFRVAICWRAAMYTAAMILSDIARHMTRMPVPNSGAISMIQTTRIAMIQAVTFTIRTTAMGTVVRLLTMPARMIQARPIAAT